MRIQQHGVGSRRADHAPRPLAVAVLHAQGKKVICYFDAGVYETYRTHAGTFPKSMIGRADAGWDGSYWLDVHKISVLEPIMKARCRCARRAST